MIAQLSHSEPFGRSSSSSSGVRSAGSLPRNSGVPFFPQTSSSSKSSRAARTKIRALRLFTLGFRMLRVFVAISPPPSVLHQSRLVLAPPQASPWDELDARLDDQHVAQSLADRVGQAVTPVGVARELDDDGQRRLLLHAVRLRLDQDVPADLGR